MLVARCNRAIVLTVGVGREARNLSQKVKVNTYPDISPYLLGKICKILSAKPNSETEISLKIQDLSTNKDVPSVTFPVG